MSVCNQVRHRPCFQLASGILLRNRIQKVEIILTAKFVSTTEHAVNFIVYFSEYYVVAVFSTDYLIMLGASARSAIWP